MNKPKAAVTGIERSLLRDLERVTDRVIAALADFKFALGQIKERATNEPDGALRSDRVQSHSVSQNRRLKAQEADFEAFVDPRGVAESPNKNKTHDAAAGDKDGVQGGNPASPSKDKAGDLAVQTRLTGQSAPRVCDKDISNPREKLPKDPGYKYCKLDGARYRGAIYEPYCSERCKRASQRDASAKQGLRTRWSDEKNRNILVDAQGNEVEIPPSKDDFTLTRDGLRS